MQRRVLKQFVELTLILHGLMAAAVFVDAVIRGRDKRWALGTLVGGVFGAVPYLAAGAVQDRFGGDDEEDEFDDEELDSFDENAEIEIEVAE